MIANQSNRDMLTNLYNRRYFNNRIVEEIAGAQRKQEVLAVLLCDLDEFKNLNDRQGHQAGDLALVTVARCIQESVRGSDLIFRWGGDEIIVVLTNTSREGVLVAAERIRKDVRRVSERDRMDLDVSIGASLYPEHSTDPEQLVHLADRAMYIAKKSGEKIHIGEEEYHLDDRSIDVVFQPIIDIRDNQVLGYEALSRDPQGRRSIASLFKKYQAIGQLHALKALCFRLQLNAAQEAHLQKVFLNVAFELLKELDVPPTPPGMEVVLEISEAEVLQDVEDHLKVARKWKREGYQFAIDDFGAGFVSLPFIARLVPEYIKLDRSTLLQAVSSDQFTHILKDLLKALWKTSAGGIIVEGVENDKELAVVKQLGTHLVQGFLFGKPQALS